MEKYLTQLECTFVRETMLRQEEEYEIQLRELHRLYSVQRTLLEESRNRSSNLGCGQEFLRALNGTTGLQFFPVKKETDRNLASFFQVKKEPDTGTETRKRRCFDLEKLPDEQPEELEADLYNEPATKYSRTKEEDFVHCPKTRNGLPEKFPAADQHALQKPHWLLQAHANVENSAWNNSRQSTVLPQHPKLASSGPNSWLQLSQGNESKLARDSFVTYMEPNTWNTNGFTSAYTPVMEGLLANGSWYNRQAQGIQQSLQQNFHQVHFPQQQQQQQQKQMQKNGVFPTLSYPWQTSASGYFPNGIFSTSSAPTLNGVREQVHWLSGNYAPGGNKLSKDSFKKPRCDPVVKQPEESSTQQNQHQDLQRQVSDTDRKQVNQGISGDKPDATTDDDMASILMSLRLDTTVLKDSVVWFANAMPEAKMEDSVEVDQFEAATLQLQRLEEQDQFITDMQVLREATDAAAAAALARDEKPSSKTTSSGRPCRRRGKKKVDFQTETLPRIASLSRQEINDDLQLMGGLIRSANEYEAACNNKRNGKCGAKSSPVSTLEDVARSPRRRNTNPKKDTALPWLVGWGESTRRKRKQRLRGNHPKALHVVAVATDAGGQ